MRMQTPILRLTAVVTTAALLMGSTAMSFPAWAQQPTQPFQAPPDQAPPNPNMPDQSPPNQNAVDPPARVGRLVTANGAVSYHTAGDTQWTPASMNFPVAAGSSFWTEPNAMAILELSASRVSLAGGTSVDIGTLDANGFQATLTQGQVLLSPRTLESGETWTLVTPRGTVTTSHAGRIEVTAGDTASPTIVSVLEGDATITGPGLSQTLTAGQAATITGTDPLTVTVGPAQPDAFAQAEQTRDRPPLPPPASAQSVPPPPGISGLPGGNELQAYGAWNNDQEYGQVWYPSVDPAWVPYRQGHWAFIAPWGWTWVDDAPWGFAPFHYGRWVELHGRWGWTPGFERDRRERYPVYAPALVTFLGLGIGGAIGWVPLGPREAYRPWYHASPRYVGALNGNRPLGVIAAVNLVNRRVATQVPTAAMIGSRPLRTIAQPVGAQVLANAHPVSGLHPVMPVATTAGITPLAAQHLHLTPAPTGVVHAPGPVIVPHAATTSLPVLRPPLAVPAGPAPHLTGPVAPPPVGGPPRPGPQFTTPQGVQHPPLPPPAVLGPPHAGPQLTTPLGVQHPPLPPPVVTHTAPQLTTPLGVQHPPPPPTVVHPTPQFAAPPPVAHPAPPFPPPVQHFQQPPPPVHVAPPPQPQFHPAPPPPQPQFHPAPPPPPQPQFHPAPPPPPVHVAPPPPPPHPAAPTPPPHQKRPGEP